MRWSAAWTTTSAASRRSTAALGRGGGGEDDNKDEETRAARLEEENLTLRERLFLMERDMADLRRRLVAVEELCRDRHSDGGCVVDPTTADEAARSESAAAVVSPGACACACEEADAMEK